MCMKIDFALFFFVIVKQLSFKLRSPKVSETAVLVGSDGTIVSSFAFNFKLIQSLVRLKYVGFLFKFSLHHSYRVTS